MSPRIAVIGAGIVGAAVAARLAERGDDVVLFEKEQAPAQHQTGRNSGVVHAGLYYEPGSLKARLTRRGVELLREYCARRDVAYDECGKLVVAHSPQEEERLAAIEQRARANGVPGIRTLDADGIRVVEPHAVGRAALHSPATAIVDYPAMTSRLVDDVAAAGGRLHFGEAVTRTRARGREQLIETARGEEPFDLVVACAGLQSDRLARRSGAGRFPAIVPFSGDYYELRPEAAALVRGLLYPVPDPAYPFLGVHLTRMIDGRVTVGPNAFLALARERYGRGAVDARDAAETIGSPAFWRFAGGNAGAAIEQARSASKRAFIEGARRFVPALTADDLTARTRGIRAQAMHRDGSLLDDFAIERVGNAVLVRNAPSPAATSSLAIAERIVEREVDGRG